mmetsp:Transcript_16317/g.18100  ORF Transcript_16317/g.18100 Transcript_16317/m.18100 type:complete len:87 (+) Transcript_16317:952-1212(+)
MTISFFFELTAEDPYIRKDIYIEGITFILLNMLFFCLLFLTIYYFSYGWLYRTYLVDKIAITMKERKKVKADLKEISEAMGREVDT